MCSEKTVWVWTQRRHNLEGGISKSCLSFVLKITKTKVTHGFTGEGDRASPVQGQPGGTPVQQGCEDTGEAVSVSLLLLLGMEQRPSLQ